MDKKLFGVIGLSGLACLACCALPLISIAGISAGVTSIWNGSLVAAFAGFAGLLLFIFFFAKKRSLVSCKENSCGIHCGCKQNK